VAHHALIGLAQRGVGGAAQEDRQLGADAMQLVGQAPPLQALAGIGFGKE